MSSKEEITALMTKRDELQDLTQTIINTLNNITNIKTTPDLKLEFASRLTSFKKYVTTTQNDIKLKMHMLLMLQNKIITSIESNHNNIHQNTIDMCKKKFDELNNEISKHTTHSTNLLNEINMRLNTLNMIGVNEPEYSGEKDIHHINGNGQSPILSVMSKPASEKEVIKPYVNMGCSNIIKYEDECYKILDKKILIVLDNYLKGGLKKHTDLLVKFLKCDVVVFEKSIKSHENFKDINYEKYDIILWQNTFNIIPQKQLHQKYIYVVHSHCDLWSETNKEVIKNNNNLIDNYIYVSNNVKNNFEQDILIPTNSYIIENQIEQIVNTKFEIKGLFVGCGSYTQLKGHYELIQEFAKFDNTLCQLEIYGNIHDIEYYNMLQKYIDKNKISNIKLLEYTEDYVERLKEAEYFCFFSKSEGCSYAILEAMSLNKKIICPDSSITFEQIYYYPYKTQQFYGLINMNRYYVFPNYRNFIKKYTNICLNIPNNKIYIGCNVVNDDIDEKILEKDINIGLNIELKKGLSFLLRLKNEEKYILNNIYSIVNIADEIIICNNCSTDDTSKILKYLENYYDNIFIYEYNICINNLKDNIFFPKRKIGTFYNWCLSKATTNNVMKWDGDFESIQTHLSTMIDKYDLHNRCDKFALWFSGLTCFYLKYINVSSYYDEYRCFSKLNGFKWTDTKNCETVSEYIRNCHAKFINGYEDMVVSLCLAHKAKIVDINRMPIFIEHKDYNDYKINPFDNRCINDNNILTKYKDVSIMSNNNSNAKNIVFVVFYELDKIGGVEFLNNIIVKSIEYTGCIVKYIILKKSNIIDNIKYFSLDSFNNCIPYFNGYNISILTSYHDDELIIIKRKYKHIRLFGMSHSDISFYNRDFTRQKSYYENIIVINKFTYNKYIELDVKNITLLENNIPLLTINKKHTFNKNNIPALTINNKHMFDKNNTCDKNCIKCLFFSRASYDKNLIMLMQSIDILSQKYNIYLDVYSEINHTLEYYYNLLVNKKNIKFMSPILCVDSSNIYDLYDIVMLPSVSEGCSLNVLEAINNEIPILCSKNIGNYEIINNELPMFDLTGLSIHDNDIYVYNYNKLLESIGYCFEPNATGLDILTPNLINDSKKIILYNNNLNEIINKIEYTINNYDKVKQNTVNLKKKITNKFFNMASYILKLNSLLSNKQIIDERVD
jgi:hypothetical protein